MNILINSCKKTVELIDKQTVIPLTITEKMQLELHKVMCKTCNAYEQQSKFMDKMIANWFGQANSGAKVKFPEERKTKIIEEIKKM